MLDLYDHDVAHWATAFDSPDPQVRHAAREHLVGMGTTGAGLLEELLADSRKTVRWEAALGLKDLADPASVPSLVEALKDTDPDVRWIAAEALAEIGDPSIRPVLASLARDGDSFELRESAHLFINSLDDPDVRFLLDPVEDALGKKTAPEGVMEAAAQVLRSWPSA